MRWGIWTYNVRYEAQALELATEEVEGLAADAAVR